ncbi:MAG: hypothetical protein P8X98_12475 [Woeseiaceae bacterium]
MTYFSNPARFAVPMSLLMILAACGGDDDSSTSPPDNGGGGGGAPSAPVGVAVVAGDTDSTEVQNTISWVQDPDAASFTVYWSNTAGVTESSSVVVPAAAGARYFVHSDVDVLA